MITLMNRPFEIIANALNALLGLFVDLEEDVQEDDLDRKGMICRGYN